MDALDDGLDATEIVLLTRPSHTLTCEEKAQRRRIQFKLHQRRHRAKQQQLTGQLERRVRVLTQQITRLDGARRALLRQATTPVPRPQTSGAGVAQVAMEYVRQFEFGLGRGDAQERFLRATMVPNVGGPDYQGIDELLVQWGLYGRFFHRTQYVADGVDVKTAGDLTVVVVRVVLVIHARREGVLALCPRIGHDEDAIQAMVGSALRIPGTLRFVFNADGVCSWLGAEMDFVAGLQRVLGDLKKVALCMEDANMSFCTGQITPPTTTRGAPAGGIVPVR